MKPLTAKQQKVLSFLQERAQTGVPPTVREICLAAGIKSTSTVHTYLKVLEEGGYTFPVYYDDLSECAYAYGINAIPVTAFIDADGNLVSMKTGAMNAADLERRIQTILG